MTKRIRYSVSGLDAIKQDNEWRRDFICGVDKEYSILFKRNNSHRSVLTLDILVSDDTALLFKFRYPNHAHIENYVR